MKWDLVSVKINKNPCLIRACCLKLSGTLCLLCDSLCNKELTLVTQSYMEKPYRYSEKDLFSKTTPLLVCNRGCK